MNRLWDRLAMIGATGLGAGLSPFAPGTVGALWGIPLSWIAYRQIPGWPLRFALLTLLVAIGVPMCQRAAELLGRKDPGSVVWDEIASMPWVFCWLPTSALGRWDILLAGFLLHRVFDVLKPPPARQLERLPGGWGIMADDLAAAIYASVVLLLVAPYLPNWTVG